MESRPPLGRESGQAAVEAAIVMPVMIMVVLGILQLTMVQHARIMTEYAAFNAARAGIVWNGNNVRMHDAALVSLLPTMGRTNNLSSLAVTYGKAALWDAAWSQLTLGAPVPDSVNGANLIGQIRVDTVYPSLWSGVGDVWKLPWANAWQELDFDGADTYPEFPKLGQYIFKFFNLSAPESSEDTYRKATVLRIRLRYFYELRIPFANWIIFKSWYAANAGVSLMGGIGMEQVNHSSRGSSVNILSGNGSANSELPWLGIARGGIPHKAGYDSMYGLEMGVLWALSTGKVPILSSLLGGPRYFMPLTTTYSMRMQSNFHRKWIMHVNPDWGM